MSRAPLKHPRYGRIIGCTQPLYIRSWSRGIAGLPGWHVWCEDCADFHRVETIKPSEFPGPGAAVRETTP